MTVKLISAVFDEKPKTKFLHVHGQAEVESFEDSLQVSIAEPQGINPSILLLNLVRIDGNGPKKPQAIPFSFSHAILSGELSYKQVQVVYGNDSDVIDIEVV